MIEWKTDDDLPSIDKSVSQDQIIKYASVSGDSNPLHLDQEFASTTQFGGVIAHGMLTLAFISEMLTKAFGKAWLETGSLKVRLKGAARPGDIITAWGTITRADFDGLEAYVGVNNHKGDELIGGLAAVKLSRERYDESTR